MPWKLHSIQNSESLPAWRLFLQNRKDSLCLSAFQWLLFSRWLFNAFLHWVELINKFPPLLISAEKLFPSFRHIGSGHTYEWKTKHIGTLGLGNSLQRQLRWAYQINWSGMTFLNDVMWRAFWNRTEYVRTFICTCVFWGSPLGRFTRNKTAFHYFFVLQKQNSLHCSHIRPKDYNKASIYILYEVHTRVGPQFICS